MGRFAGGVDCHSECNEESLKMRLGSVFYRLEILHYVQNDKNPSL